MHPSQLDDLRRAQNLLTIEEVVRLIEAGNRIYDPYSALISARAQIGGGNTIFPCVYLLCEAAGELTIGDRNIFHTNTLVEASLGAIVIGSGNQFGEGGFTAKANRPGAHILIGDTGRYQNGAAVFGESELGSGSQLLGAITVDSCRLEAGDTFRDPDPDLRAGLLKGSGVARNITVPRGKVILGVGTFSAEKIQPQSDFHPKR
ncbi:hypothetical protein GCM10007874_13450 [Labrys miyagiensis]|uniref:AraC family transcriptional regulator n=1 Tax=Labrys miyagiensis TaxID=346912 RepID=A0ABQ6CDI3_9HYPH|nr:AraC family transcriptional regulator [Labrys miyagiensis]GLS18328.1 hypothetical protein GCM10007874_13450 [Labrys miyagiensis]